MKNPFCIQLTKKCLFIIMLILFQCSFLFAQTDRVSKQNVHSYSELGFIDAINAFRKNPSAYIDTLNEYIKQDFLAPEEIIIAKNELIPFLKKTKPLNELVVNDDIRIRLEKHRGVKYERRDVVHDNSFSWLKKYDHELGENICSSQGDYYTGCIINMLIDYNVPDRGHRKAIMDPLNKTIAVIRIAFGDESDRINYNVFWIQEYIH